MKTLKDVRVVLLAGPGDSTRAVANLLKENAQLCGVILEEPPSRYRLLQRRAKKLGHLEVIGQVLFILLSKIAARLNQARISNLYSEVGFDTSTLPEETTHRLESVNTAQARELLVDLSPDIVVVNGTRIISQETLDSIKAPFINTHAGITPKYRGVHGGYWALALEDEANCGVTVHFVDKGIDTGEIISQARIRPSSQDNFLTYPVLQLAAAKQLLLQAILDTANGNVTTTQTTGPSNLFYHPTLWGYLKTYLRLGVR